jgi:hypothetical protein
MTFDDASCMMSASAMSCAAMHELAREEASRNVNVLSYNVLHPMCSRFQELADRKDEHELQKPPQFAKKLCFTKTPQFQDGPWRDQFAPIPRPLEFDVQTRRR